MPSDRTFYLFPPISESWVDRDAQGFVNDIIYAAVYSGDSNLQRLMKTGGLNDLAMVNSALQSDFASSIKAFLPSYPAIKSALLKDLSLTMVESAVKVTGTLELESANGLPMVKSLITATLPTS